MNDLRRWMTLCEAVANRPRIFYRGINAGADRILTGDTFWDKHLFVSSDLAGAKFYGHTIIVFIALPEARILYEGTREFRSVAKGLGSGRRGYVNISLERHVEIVRRATDLGYDAVWFERQTDIGTVIINPAKFHSGEKTLTERAIRLDANGHPLTVIENPSIQQLLSLLDRSTDEQVKGLIIGSELFFWSATSIATHGHVAEKLWPTDGRRNYWEYPEYVDGRLLIQLDDGHPTLDFDFSLLTNPRILVLLKSDRLYFHCPGAGFMNYSEYVANEHREAQRKSRRSIDESVEQVGNPSYRVDRNPTSNALQNLVTRSRDRILKGLYEPGSKTVYVWDAYHASHHMAEYDLGLPYGGKGMDAVSLVIGLNDDGRLALTVLDDRAEAAVRAHASLRHEFSEPDAALLKRWQ